MNRVKNFIGAMSEKGVRTVKRAVPAFFTAYCYFSMYVPVYAAKATGTSVITSGFNSLYEIVAAIVSSIGQLLLLWGVFEWATALNSQDGTMQSMAIWNSSMRLIIKLVCSTPQKFSTGTWAFVKENLYPWAEGIGLSALNLFFMIAFLKAVSNLHQNITLEMVIEAMVKVVVANVLYLNILNIMTTIFSISSAMAKEVFTIDAPDLKVEDMDIGSALFYQLFGLLFILAAIVCSFLMLWTVYSRYIKLYLLMILAPFAMSALVGGQEIERSFYAWMRTFLLNAFEIVVIALTMVISFKLIGAGISLFDGKNIVTSMVDGFWDALNSLFTMILVTAAVKGSNAFLSKAMGL